MHVAAGAPLPQHLKLIYVNADTASRKSVPLPVPLREKIIGYERVQPESAPAKL